MHILNDRVSVLHILIYDRPRSRISYNFQHNISRILKYIRINLQLDYNNIARLG